MHFNETERIAVLKEFEDERWFDNATETYLVLFYCVVILFGVTSNALVCFIVWRYKYLQIPRNILIVNLSVCDILMCIFCMPLSLIKLTVKNWHFGGFLCRLFPSLQNIDVFVSTFTVVAIAVDRYWAIVRVSRDESYKHKVYYMLLIIWFLAVACCVPMFVFHTVEDVMNEWPENYGIFRVCMEKWPSNYVRGIYTLFVMAVQYIAPLIIISSLHAKICQVLRKRIQRDPITSSELRRALRDVQRHKKNMLLLTTIAISFALTWLPWTVLNISADFDYNFLLHKDFNLTYAICLLIAMSSACANPILYGWFNTNFRESFLITIRLLRRGSADSRELETYNKTSSRERRQYSDDNVKHHIDDS